MIKHNLLQAAKAFGLLVALYLLTGVAAYLMPDAAVNRHVKRSLDRGEFREDYPKAIITDNPDCQDQYTLDNFTDALILNQVVHLRSEGLKGILLMPRYDEGVVQHHNLVKTVYGEESPEGQTIDYARYWHGSTFLARIMLTFATYASVRYLLYFLSSVLLLWCMLRLWKTLGGITALIFTFSLLVVNVFVMQFSLQFVPVLFIALGGIVWLTYHKGKESYALPFLVLGSLTAFLDLITVPTLTLGLPLVTLVALRRDNDLKRGLTSVIGVSLWWLAGYVLTWAAKWGLATLFTGENIFVDAYGQGARWSEGGSSFIGNAFTDTLGHLHWKYVLLAAAALVVASLAWRRKPQWTMVVQYALVMLIPAAYLLLMAHPVAHHSWFNYRAWATSVMALLLLIASFVDWEKIYDKRRKTPAGD